MHTSLTELGTLLGLVSVSLLVGVGLGVSLTARGFHVDRWLGASQASSCVCSSLRSSSNSCWRTSHGSRLPSGGQGAARRCRALPQWQSDTAADVDFYPHDCWIIFLATSFNKHRMPTGSMVLLGIAADRITPLTTDDPPACGRAAETDIRCAHRGLSSTTTRPAGTESRP